MARLARLVVPRLLHHITQSGARYERVFFEDDDYFAYLALNAVAARKSGTEIFMRTISSLMLLITFIPLASCGRGRVAEHWAQYEGDPRSNPGEISEGSAFGVPIGMSHKEAVSILNGNHLSRRAAFCFAPSLSLEPRIDSVDYSKTAYPEELQCKYTLQEVWYSYANISGVWIFGEPEVIIVGYKDHQVTSIEWRGGGNKIG